MVKLLASTPSLLRGFYEDERGEVGPATYFFALVPALVAIFFAFDTGLSKGARLGTEYAAFCAARAAATQMPKGEETSGGACASGAERDAIRHAAAACLASVVKKTSAVGRLDMPGGLDPVISRAESQTQIEIQDQNGGSKNCFGHNEVVQVEVRYRHDMYLPFSPLAWGGNRPLEIKATAQAMLHTTK
jgi:hypothetical protein